MLLIGICIVAALAVGFGCVVALALLDVMREQD